MIYEAKAGDEGGKFIQQNTLKPLKAFPDTRFG